MFGVLLLLCQFLAVVVFIISCSFTLIFMSHRLRICIHLMMVLLLRPHIRVHDAWIELTMTMMHMSPLMWHLMMKLLALSGSCRLAPLSSHLSCRLCTIHHAMILMIWVSPCVALMLRCRQNRSWSVCYQTGSLWCVEMRSHRQMMRC